MLVDAGGRELAADRKRARSVDVTHHPEFEVARWAARHLDTNVGAAATVYTSGEHCPMCAAAHARVGLGRIVYIASAGQHAACRQQHGHAMGAVPDWVIRDVAPGVPVEGPVAELAPDVLTLYRRYYGAG